MPDLKEEEYDLCHSNDNLTDSSQSTLQTVLVTFRIDKPSVKHIKRVRFNSLVEVKFIPRRKKEKKRKNKLEAEDREENPCADDATEETNHGVSASDNLAGKVTDFKGEVSICEQWVATATEKVSETGKKDSCLENAPQKFEVEVEKALDKPSSNSTLNAETSERTSSVKEITSENNESGSVNAGVVKSRRILRRESYTTNKITLGEDYIGNAMRLGPMTFPITPPIQFSEFPARNAKRQSLHEFGPKTVWRLEKQAVKFCQEAEALITQVTENNAQIQSKLKQQSATILYGGNQRHAFSKEYTSFKKPSMMPGNTSFEKPASQDVCGGKPVTRFPYINRKKQRSMVGLSPTSSPSELCLPQLLFYDGNGAGSPPARADGRGEYSDNRESKREHLKPAEATKGKLFIHYSYGAAKKLGLR